MVDMDKPVKVTYQEGRCLREGGENDGCLAKLCRKGDRELMFSGTWMKI